MLAAEIEFSKQLFIDGTRNVAEAMDPMPFSPEMKNAALATGITVFNRDVKILNEPWLTGRIGWSVLVNHPLFGKIRISSSDYEEKELSFF